MSRALLPRKGSSGCYAGRAPAVLRVLKIGLFTQYIHPPSPPSDPHPFPLFREIPAISKLICPVFWHESYRSLLLGGSSQFCRPAAKYLPPPGPCPPPNPVSSHKTDLLFLSRIDDLFPHREIEATSPAVFFWHA